MSDDWGEGSLPAEIPVQRASDDDRAVVITRLRDAVGRGILDLDELEDRIGLVYQAKTMTALARITGDLPAVPDDPAGTSPLPGTGRDIAALRSSGFRMHLAVYVLVIGMLIGIWLVSGAGHPWPFYPAAGWGIGLGAHFMAANEAVRRRERRGVRQGEAPDDTPKSVPPPAPRRSEPAVTNRRFVVAMFADVVGSTELNEALGDEAWFRVRERFRETLGECATAEGGWEANVAGDGVLARFDHPASAVRAAIEVQRRLERDRQSSGFAPTIRIGIHSGDVVTDGDDLIGSVVNLASRVTSAAEPGEIFITEHVGDHVGASVVTEGRGLHTLKGLGQPRHLLAVRWR